MNLLEQTISRLKSEASTELAVIRASAPDIAKLEQIASSIAAHAYPVTPTANPIITPHGNHAEYSLIVTASASRAADLIQLLETKGITAERGEPTNFISVFAQTWHLVAFGSMPITLYIRESVYPKKAVQAQEVAA